MSIGEAAVDVVADTSKLGSTLKAGLGVAAGIFAAAGAAAGAAFHRAVEQEAGEARMVAALGLSPAEAEEAGQVAANVYMSAWGESLEEVQSVATEVFRVMRGESSEAIQGVTEDVLALQETFDVDFNETIRAAQELVAGGLAPSMEEALDIVAKGLQDTKGPTDEVLAAITEYSTHFAQLGLDAPAVLAAVSGEYATSTIAIDKAGDAVKEFGIRVLDGSDTSKQALSDLGFSIEDVSAAFAEGGPAAQRMTQDIFNAITSLDDPITRNQAAVALLGTPYEDLGSDAVAVLTEIANATGAVGDVTGSIQDNLTTTGTVWTEVWRTAQQTFTEFIGDKTLPLAKQVGEGILSVFEELRGPGGVGAAFERMSDLVQGAISKLVSWLASGGITQILNALLSGRQRLLDAALQLFPAILDALILFVPQLLEFITGSLIPAIIQILLEGIPLLLETAVSVFTTLVEGVQTVLPALLETLLGEVLPQLLVTLLGMVPDILNAGLNVFNQLIQAVTTILPQLLTTLLTVVLPQVIRTLLGMIPQLIQTGITVFKSLITAVLEVLPDLLSTLLGTVLPDVIVTLINMIPELLDTAIEVFTALVDGIIEVIPDIANAIIFDVIPAIVTAIIEGVPKILGAAKDLLGGMITGIKEKAGEVIEAMKKWVLDKIPGFVKDFFGIASPSKMFTEFGHNIVDGLVKGITSSSGDVDDAIGRLAGNASGRLAGLAADISPAITSATGGPTGGGVSIGNLTIDLDITFTGPVTEAKAREAGQAAADAAIERLSRARLVH